MQLNDILVGNRYHTAGSEPYFFGNSYTITRGPGTIPVDLNGRCVVAEEIGDRNKGYHPTTEMEMYKRVSLSHS